jgi:MYXO-CTERM domain-containing protein
LGGSDRALVQDNTVDQWLSVDSSNQVAVRNNTVNGGYIGLEMGTAGSDNVFSGNTVNNAGTGVSLSNAGTKERILFANNTISSSSQWGAQIQCGDGNPTIQQLYFYKNTIQGTGGIFPNAGVGLRFNCDVATIQNITLNSNTLTNNNGFGLVLGSWPGANNFKNLRVVNNTITNNKELAVTGSFGGGLPWQLGAPPAGLGLTFAGAAATDNNRNPVNELSWSGNTLTGNGAGYIGNPWPSDRQNANNQWASTGTFFPGHVPSVSIIAPSLATVGQPVQFKLSYIQGGAGPLANVLWDLGDGLPATTQNASFTYLNPGTYNIDLVVWDSSGRAAHNDVLLRVIPEPPALTMALGLGGAGLFWVWRRRRKLGDRNGNKARLLQISEQSGRYNAEHRGLSIKLPNCQRLIDTYASTSAGFPASADLACTRRKLQGPLTV